MPNQRSKDKKSLTFWVSNEVKDQLEAHCKTKGISRTDAIQQAIELLLFELEEQGNQNKKADQTKRQKP